MPDRSHWGLLGANNTVGSPAADAIGVWAQANALDGSPAAGLLSQQVCGTTAVDWAQDACMHAAL
jgi:hypothetical protein